MKVEMMAVPKGAQLAVLSVAMRAEPRDERSVDDLAAGRAAKKADWKDEHWVAHSVGHSAEQMAVCWVSTRAERLAEWMDDWKVVHLAVSLADPKAAELVVLMAASMAANWVEQMVARWVEQKVERMVGLTVLRKVVRWVVVRDEHWADSMAGS